MWAESGSVPIYVGKEGGEVTGTLQEGIVLPSEWNNQHPNKCGGVGKGVDFRRSGYLYFDEDAILAGIIADANVEEEIPTDGEEDGDLCEDAEETLLF